MHHTTPHYTHCITPHYTTLRYTTLHYTNCITIHYANCITLRYTTLRHTTLHHTTPHYTQLHYTTLPYPTLHYIALHCITLHYITLHSLPHHKCNCNYTTLITLHHNYNSTTHNYNYSCTTPHYLQQLWVRWPTRWPLQPLQPLQQTRLQPPFGPSVDSLCHPWLATTNLSYRFPIFETSATALCGTTGNRGHIPTNITVLSEGPPCITGNRFLGVPRNRKWLISLFNGGLWGAYNEEPRSKL